MASNASNFYRELPFIEHFGDFFGAATPGAVPGDWWVVITDVVESTRAIEEGRYKDVNIAGGLVVMAISNICTGLDFPYVFGGDGATCLIPSYLHDQVADILYSTREKVEQYFDLDLRVGMVQVQALYDAGYDLRISKIQVSNYYEQAILDGTALDAAEHWIKQDPTDNPFLIRQKQNAAVEADFTGFTCRWQDVPSTKGETIATIIKLNPAAENSETIIRILQEVENIFGEEANYHPIQADQLRIAQSEKYLGLEALVFSKYKRGWSYWRQLWRIRKETLLTRLAMFLRLKVNVNWYRLDQLRQYQSLSSDYRKFDGSLKMILSCTTADRRRWATFLQSLHEAGLLYYGIHVSDRALMTCLLHADSQQEVHFVDAGDGGYALAARQMKAQMLASSAG